MMRHGGITLAFVLGMCQVAQAEPILLKPGAHLNYSELALPVKGSWLGLYEVEGKSGLVAVAVQVTQPDPDDPVRVVDAAPLSPREGISQPLFVVQSESLTAGMVRKAKITLASADRWSHYSFLPPRMTMALQDNYDLQLNLFPDYCELSLHNESQMQRIGVGYPNLPYDERRFTNSEAKRIASDTWIGCNAHEGFPVLEWAGDLDRDDRLDFILTSKGLGYQNESGVVAELYLSTAADKDSLVKKVASTIYGGS